jgi:hypothetical protein
MIKEIATWLVSKCPTLSIDVNFFAGHLPLKRSDGTDVPDQCWVILENVPGAVVPQLPDRVDKFIQIWNRNKTFFTARADAYMIYDIIHGTTGWTLPIVSGGPEWYIAVIDAMATPAPVENPDDKGRFCFSTNFLFRILLKIP